MLIQMAISRSREFMADESAAHYSGKPLALASALRKIEAWSQRIPMEHGSPATAHMYISNPFSGGMANLFSTHPPTANASPGWSKSVWRNDSGPPAQCRPLSVR